PVAARKVDNRVIIRLKSGQDASALLQQFGGKGRKLLRHPQGDVELVDLPAGQQERALQALRASGAVEYAEPDYVLGALAEPNDFRFWDGSLWNLKNTGAYGGTAGDDIHAAAGWDIRT